MPKNSQANSQPIYYSEEYRNSLGRLIDLTKAQESRLKKKLKREVLEWIDDASGLHERLQRWNDLVDNVVEETDYPFEGASNVHIQVIAIYMKVYHSVLRRSILGAENIWNAQSDDESLADFIPQVEENLNYKARNVWNISEAISDVIWTTCRDTLGVMQIPYVEQYEENVSDFVLVSNDQEFLQEFPPDDPGIDKQEWESWRQRVGTEATDENPVEIPITYDKVIYRGPKGEVIDLADFVIFPATAKSIEREFARGHGHRFYMRRGEIKRKLNDGIWFKDATERLLSKNRSGSEVSGYMKSKDQTEGLNRSGRSDDYEFFSLVYYCDLENDGVEKKYLLIYSREAEEIVSFIAYPYRMDFYVIFRIGKKPNRLPGFGVPESLDGTNEAIDTIFNQRINSRKISEIPTFKAKLEEGSDFDPESMNSTWKPGRIFWMKNPEAFQQFIVQPTDLRGSMEEQRILMTISSLDMGVEPFSFSGNAMDGDKDAPGNKTAMLINQSNLRMDDPLEELRTSIGKVGDVCVSHEYQFGPAQVQYVSRLEGNDWKSQSFSKRVLRSGIKMKMGGINVIMNPDYEFKKWYSYYQALTPDPMIGQRAKSRWELLMRAMRAGRVDGREKILPTLQELDQERIEVQKRAILRMAQQKAAQDQQNVDLKKEQLKRIIKSKIGQNDLAIRAHKQKESMVKDLVVAGAGNGNWNAAAR